MTLLVRVSRDSVEVVGEGFSSSSGSLLVLLPGGGRALILNVGGTEAEARALLIEGACAGHLRVAPRVVMPGQDAWWDEQIAWPPPRKKVHKPPADDSEAFIFNPLATSSWDPPATLSLVRYAIYSSSPKLRRSLKWSLLPPKLTLELAGDFTAVERGEVLDQIEETWGRSRVQGPADVPRYARFPWSLLSWAAGAAALAVTLYAVSHHWPLWQRLTATLVALSPVFLAKRKQEQLAYSAPRRGR